MKNQSSIIITNKKWWEKMVKEECGFTRPWLKLDPDVIRKFANGQLKSVPVPLNDIFPASVLIGVKDKNVLCLASGGGQQSVIFGLLGAHVTIVDISKSQLAGDKKAAKHYGYEVTTIQADMSKLSTLDDKSFDLVYQAPSMGYIPDVGQVYSEVARVLRSGGLYRVDAQNPLSQFVDESSWDGKGYRISVPYAVKKQLRTGNKEVIEFRHYLDDIFNGLIECGFAIERVQEAPFDLYQNKQDKPGSWGHSLRYLPGLFAILARKK
ncbi:MAG: class I SAM-dependent methyltransferase [Patescibacteria group bacterium]